MRLRAEIAHHYWSEDERYQILIEADPVIQDAIDLLPEAKALYEKSLQMEEQQAHSN